MTTGTRLPSSHRPFGICWLQPLPRSRPVRREDFLAALCRHRRTIHVGFVDEPLLAARLADGTWLHARIAQAARSLVGIDSSENGIEWARRHGFECYAVDAQSVEAVQALGIGPAEVVVAGEIIEHLDAPGPFLHAMRALTSDDGLLIVTTPNAYRPLNALAAVCGRELIHPDHVAWHSPHTLRTLLERNGWVVEHFAYYRNDLDVTGVDDAFSRRAATHVANGVRILTSAIARWLPYWSDGVVAVARKQTEEGR